MQILSSSEWQDYELIDSGFGERLERFGDFILVRPDPQAIWRTTLSKNEWENCHAFFERTSADKGKWILKKSIPKQWVMKYKQLSFICKLTPFKHTGVFPEQSIQWDWIIEKIKSSKTQINILNLFGYTGIASLAAAFAGAKVTHVDASYPTIGWAKDNQKLSHLNNKPIRWILDDAIKFVQREKRRKVFYDAIILDPPVFGHGPKGELWEFNKSFPELVKSCKDILSKEPKFILVNAYAISASCLMLENVLNDYLKDLNGVLESGELVLTERSAGRKLSTGIYARWEAKE